MTPNPQTQATLADEFADRSSPLRTDFATLSGWCLSHRDAILTALRRSPDPSGEYARGLRDAASLVTSFADLAAIPQEKAARTERDDSPIIAGQDYRGTEFNDAAMTVEKIVADWPGLGGEELYRRFRMVFGDPQTNPAPSAVAAAVRAEWEACAKIVEEHPARDATVGPYGARHLMRLALASAIRAHATTGEKESGDVEEPVKKDRWYSKCPNCGANYHTCGCM